jgi:hypothetical protein
MPRSVSNTSRDIGNPVLEFEWDPIPFDADRSHRWREEAVILSPDWKRLAREELVVMRGGSPAWGYHRTGAPCVEPTALACLGLLATAGHESVDGLIATTRESASWMAAIQRAGGSLPVSQQLETPGWSTPYALLLWSRLAGYEPARLNARAWLLRDHDGPHSVRDNNDKIVGHDPGIHGWPWVDGTHPWIEPTAMAILALCRERQRDHPRVVEGIRLILDRALDRGGWNCGNKKVFGREVRPLPGPTGAALLALAAYGDRSPAVSRAVDYLLGKLPNVRAPASLGWGILGLRAFLACPIQVDIWLAEAYARNAGKWDSTINLALLLLAAGADVSSLIIPRIAPETHHDKANPGDRIGRDDRHGTGRSAGLRMG